MTASSRRERVYQRLAADLAHNQEHPGASGRWRIALLTSVLVDWLRHVEDRSGFTDSREIDQLRADLCRSLATTGTHDPAAVEVLTDQFHLQPQASDEVLAEAAQALRHIATGDHHDELASLAADRSLGACRSGILEWLAERGQVKDLHLITDQIGDPSVRATALACLRRFRPTPVELIDTVENYLYDPDRIVRHQASRTVAVLYAAVFAANSRVI